MSTGTALGSACAAGTAGGTAVAGVAGAGLAGALASADGAAGGGVSSSGRWALTGPSTSSALCAGAGSCAAAIVMPATRPTAIQLAFLSLFIVAPFSVVACVDRCPSFDLLWKHDSNGSCRRLSPD
ncbi:MAG: hypothetical protein E6R07_01290 [Nevskiaceae bacterium]|nr:MAG: hypothetical protein E6R07_01290 [Nevskiaceae bacterium]